MLSEREPRGMVLWGSETREDRDTVLGLELPKDVVSGQFCGVALFPACLKVERCQAIKHCL